VRTFRCLPAHGDRQEKLSARQEASAASMQSGRFTRSTTAGYVSCSWLDARGMKQDACWVPQPLLCTLAEAELGATAATHKNA
jgi:hypothetical protein